MYKLFDINVAIKLWQKNGFVYKQYFFRNSTYSGFPLGLENLEKWEGIFQSGKSQGILNRLEKSGKSQGKSHKILEKLGNLK